jgi:hypothetical protein
MKRIINSGECECCKGEVIYESERFKAEMTKRGLMFVLYGNCSQLEAADTYHAWLQDRDKKKESV